MCCRSTPATPGTWTSCANSPTALSANSRWRQLSTMDVSAPARHVSLWRDRPPGRHGRSHRRRGARRGAGHRVLARLVRPSQHLRGAGNHNGGRLAFGPDGMLYAGTGDAAQRGRAQDRDNLGGKILRMTPEGAPAAGNPFGGSVVWSIGHRNVQGLAWDAAGRMYASEFGQNRYDELNPIEPGRNYGWPEVEGPGSGGGRYVEPIATWATDDASPSGIAIAGERVYMACLRGQRLYRIGLDGKAPEVLLAGEYGRLRHVALAPDGSLWVLTSNSDGRGSPSRDDDRILRLTP